MITIDIFLLNKVAKVGNDVQVSQRRSRRCFRLCVCSLTMRIIAFRNLIVMEILEKNGAKKALTKGVQVSQRRSVDASGHLYVADDGNCRVQKFDSNGNFIGEWGRKGSDKGEFKFPKGVL